MSSSVVTPASAGCCSQPAAPASGIANVAGLASIQYRIGTFTSFRQAMLDQVADPDLMASSVTTLAGSIFTTLTGRVFTTLQSAITATTGQIAVLGASAFPAVAPFGIRIDSESLTVTAVSHASDGTPLWTVQRAVPAAPHNAGDTVWLDPAITAADTQIAVADASQFTVPAPFGILVGSESMTVSARSVASDGTPRWTVQRGVPASPHSAGELVSLNPAIVATDTQITVLDTSTFPAAAPFRIRVGSVPAVYEYMTVTAVIYAAEGPPLWTVQRGALAGSHNVGEFVWLDPANPFAAWHPDIAGDYQTAFIELWAYLGDVLTFYQERIANEAYLGTATQLDSLLRLVALIDYQPAPGAGASGLAAFTVAKNQTVTIPAGFGVGSPAQGSNPAVVFETSAPIVATATNSSIPLSLLAPAVLFPPGQIVLQGVATRLAVNDYLLAVEPGAPNPYLLQINSLGTDKNANTTTVYWQELSGAPYTQASTQVSVYALRVTAAPFGSSAPNWYALSPVLTNSGSDGQQHSSAPYQDNWDQGPENQNSPAPSLADSSPPSSPPSPVPPPGASLYYYIPPPGDWPYIFLDGTVNQLNYSAQNPGWAVLMTDGPTYQIVQVVDTRQVGKTGYSISAKSTRLTLIDTINQLFPLRNTTILTGSESLAVQTDLPIPDPVSGASLILAGMYAGLQDGQTVVLQGIVYASAGTAAPVTAAEMCILQGAPAVDTVNNVTTVNLKAPLTNQYLRSSCTLLANVATMTQGQTVPDEILGSGDGTAFQSWPLKQKPLTYLPSTDPDGLSTVSSTLLVTVNGVAWSEEPNLASSGPHDQVFMTTEDGTGQTTVVFGDGINGACPPTGTNNVHASYRKGLGSGGNLSAGAVQQMLGSLPGLQKVTSPMSTGGGDDADTPADIRSQAPAALQTFGRAVSVTDYAALALSYPGIAKALAAWVLQDPATGLIVAHPYVQLTVASVDEQPIAGSVLATNLRLFLDSHRDPNVLLRIQDYTPVYIAVAVSVQIDDRYPHQGTLNLVQAALNPGVNPDGTMGFFAFERMQFGESVYLSAVYAVIQAVPGVDSALIATLQPVDAGSGVTPQDISAGPTEIVVVDPSAEPASVLSITGQGGYPDS